MRVHTIRPAELGKGEIELWHQIQQTSPWSGNPFLSPEFSIAVGRFRPDSRVGVLMDGQRIAGFFPFEQRGLGVGVPLSGWLSGCQGVVHLPDAPWDAVGLVKGCGLAAWKFDNLIPDQKPFERYLSGTAQAPIIDVSGGFESYYAKVHAKAHQFCRELERKSRKLSREVGEVHMVVDTADPKPLSQLMAWKSDQYRRSNRFDRFNQPWMQGSSKSCWRSRLCTCPGLPRSCTRAPSPSPSSSACGRASSARAGSPRMTCASASTHRACSRSGIWRSHWPG